MQSQTLDILITINCDFVRVYLTESIRRKLFKIWSQNSALVYSEIKQYFEKSVPIYKNDIFNFLIFL